MTPEQFNAQMERLTNQFGKAAYSKERAKIIWREVQDFNFSWFERIVDGFIGTERYAPLLDKFSEAASRERERVYLIQKAQNTQEAEQFMKSIYSNDDIKTICGMISRRLRGGVNDQEYESFIQTLTRASG